MSLPFNHLPYLKVPGQRPPRPNRKYGTVQQPKNTVLLQPPTPPGLPSGGNPVLSVVFSDPHLKLPCSTLKPVRKWSAPCLSFRKKRYDILIILWKLPNTYLTLVKFSEILVGFIEMYLSMLGLKSLYSNFRLRWLVQNLSFSHIT